jgi:hypothetical protein
MSSCAEGVTSQDSSSKTQDDGSDVLREPVEELETGVGKFAVRFPVGGRHLYAGPGS